ncbi:TonB-dependent receptor [Massilia solisilvae]|uniref:TonB-dependent receptor n=1 Tax=Massilia solisilvae TaxID=1811225 RepID=A0ABT2BM57_9BURK|nr:TonB-dependent receptor [Massilia solisilvae]
MYHHATYACGAPLRLTIIAASLATALAAQAQETQPKATSEKTAESSMQKVEVRGAADTYDPRRDDTASKVVITHEEIVKYGDTSVTDVLKRVPGVTVSGSPGRGGEIRMRGLGNGYTQILLNGERAPAGFSMDSLAPDTIERIEVLRAASAEFSTQSVAGTINIVLKKSVSRAQRELKVGLGRGPGVTNPSVNLQLADRADGFSWSFPLNLSYQDAERPAPAVEHDYDLAGNTIALRSTDFVNRNHIKTLNSAPRLNWKLANGDQLTWQSFLNVNRVRIDLDSRTTAQVGPNVPVPTVHTPMHNGFEMLRSDLNWTHQLASGAKLDVKVGGWVGGGYSEQHRYGYRDGVQVLDSITDNRGHDYNLSSTGKYTDPLGGGHALGVGWDVGYGRHNEHRLQEDYPIAGYSGYVSDERFVSQSARVATYVQDEWNITPRWSLYLGMRWEGVRVTTSGSGFDTVHTNSSVLSPLLQTLYKLPGAKDQLRFAVTRTYKAPDLLSLPPRRFVSVNNSPTEPDVMGNPNLKPELALGFDASYEHYFAEAGLLSLSASRRNIQDFTRNMIILDGDRWVQLPSNGGTAETHSLEAEVKLPLKVLMAGAPAIDLRASVTRNWSRVDAVPGPNNRLDQQNPLSATLGIDYKAGPLTTGASFALRTGGPVRVSEQQTAYQSVRRDLDLYALWKFDPKVQLRVALSNVLRQDGLGATAFMQPDRLVTRTTTYPALMLARATLEMKF